MKLLELINEAKFAKQKKIAYHGTKPEYLRSIIKNGLIINFKENGYGSGDLGHFGVSLEPLESLYFTKTYKEAKTISNMDSLDSLVVVISYQPKEALMDEDNLFNSVLDVYKIDHLVKNIITKFDLRGENQYNDDILNGEELIQYVNKLSKNYAEEITRSFRNSLPQNNMIVQKIKDTIYSGVNEILFAAIYDKYPDIRHYQELLTRYFKKLTSSHLNNIRIPKNIGFSGSTKIVGLYYGSSDENTTYFWTSKLPEKNIIGHVVRYETPMKLLKKVESLQKGNNSINEAVYKGNLGIAEFLQFLRVATPEQKKLFNEFIKEKQYEKLNKLLKLVIGKELHPSFYQGTN